MMVNHVKCERDAGDGKLVYQIHPDSISENLMTLTDHSQRLRQYFGNFIMTNLAKLLHLEVALST